MANFTPKMLSDLLNSPDPKDQELAKQLSALEFGNEDARLANYPAPQEPDASQFTQAPQEPVVPPVQPWAETVQGPTKVGGPTPSQMAMMDKANAPVPDPRNQELVPNQFRNETTGKITTLTPTPAAPQAAPASDGVRVLDQMRQRDGSIFQLVERETPRGLVKETRVVIPDAVNPYKLAETKAAQAQATLEKTKADTAKANLPPHYQPVVKDIVDPSDPSRMIAIDANTYRGGSIGAPGVIAVSGKEPSNAKRQETVQAGLEAFQTLTKGLRDSYTALKDNGDIASSEKNPAANAINAIQASGLGQFTGKVVGTKSQDERNAITSSKNILLQSIMQATGMTARQLDSNVELKMWINSITDPSNTYESNMKILGNIENFVSTKANAISKLNGNKAQQDQKPEVTMDDIFAAAKKTGKTLDQVRKDAMAKGYSVRGM